jgi:integrase
VLARVGLENDTRPHGLRATGAKLLIEAGASLELVSQQLGHATTRTTEDYYVGNVKTDGLARFDQAFE